MGARKFRIFILGAGFSQPAGLPLADDLWSEVRRRGESLKDRAGKFESDLRAYLLYRQQCDDVTLSLDEVDFEDFMGFLDIEHFLALRGRHTWSSDGNEGTVVAKTLIGRVLAESTPSSGRIPEIYLKFAKELQSDDVVLTFNYDVLLERSLEAVGKPYRLFPDRYTSAEDGATTVDDSREEVSVLKLHGSIDWFDRTEYSQLEQQYRNLGLPTQPPHPVFAHTSELGVTKLLEGPGHADDPLNEMYRVRDVDSLYRKDIMFSATPWILVPSTVKILYGDKLRNFWYGLGSAGILNFGLSIIGYSLPRQDDYARQIVYRIVTNYQQAHWDEEMFGLRKSPLAVVNRCQDTGALQNLRRRYSFVDWSRAVLYDKGLNREAINLVAGGQLKN